jgi:hypothetical protein
MRDCGHGRYCRLADSQYVGVGANAFDVIDVMPDGVLKRKVTMFQRNVTGILPINVIDIVSRQQSPHRLPQQGGIVA